MVMARNGIAASGQVMVADIVAYTLPDTDFEAQKGVGNPNATNVFARFGGMAIGRDNETFVGSAVVGSLATNTGLNDEHDADGLARIYGQNSNPAGSIRNGIYTWVDTEAGSGNRTNYKSSFSGAWQYTGGTTEEVGEVMVVNHATKHQGFSLSRQVFTTKWTLQTNDVLRLQVKVTHTNSSFTPGGGGAKGGVIPNFGLREFARLLMDETTDRLGYNSDPPDTLDAGDWLDENEAGGAIGTPTKFDELAIGTGTGARDEADTTLGTEASGNGGSRKTGAAVAGELMADPEDFAGANANLFNNYAGDTVQWRPGGPSYFEFTAPGHNIAEAAVHNGNATVDVMLISVVYAVAIPFDQDEDRFTPILRIVSQ